MLLLNNEEFLTLHGIQNENVENEMHDCCIHSTSKLGVSMPKIWVYFWKFFRED